MTIKQTLQSIAVGALFSMPFLIEIAKDLLK
jgi:hypothetical protein